MPQTCDEYLTTADAELAAAEATPLDLSKGFRAAVPDALAMGGHYAKAYINALMALTVGTRTNR